MTTNGSAEKAKGYLSGIWRWLKKPTPRWFGGVAVLVVASTLWWAFGSNDPLPKRWRAAYSLFGFEVRNFETETQSGLYKELVNPKSLPPCGQGSALPDDGPIPPQSHYNWNCPHLAVYSLAAPPRPLTTLRDLGDRGQAEAVRLLNQSGAMKGKTLTDLRDALNDSGRPRTGRRIPSGSTASSWRPSSKERAGSLATE